MSHQEPGAARGWLPTLDVDQVFRSRSAVAEPAENTTGPSSRPQSQAPDWSAALESQFGLRTAETPPKSDQSETPLSVAEVRELQDRLDWYENFDALIRDNVSRSAALFQALFEEREKSKSVQNDAEALITAVSAEAERRNASERLHMQHILNSLMDEATFLQQRSDALVQRVAEAITEMTAFRDEDDEPVSGA